MTATARATQVLGARPKGFDDFSGMVHLCEPTDFPSQNEVAGLIEFRSQGFL
jgi:hypothetical protein